MSSKHTFLAFCGTVATTPSLTSTIMAATAIETKHLAQGSPTLYKGNGTFETANGILYVSKPYRSRNSKKLRALITFAPRNSTFDMNNEDSTKNEFRVR